MRFHRQIKITKGLSLSLSKPGIGVRVGSPGASVSFGPKGTYLNTGIPGTGISQRTKLFDNHHPAQTPTLKLDDDINVNIRLDTWGEGALRLTDKMGAEIKDESIINTVKASTRYKNTVAELKRQRLLSAKPVAPQFSKTGGEVFRVLGILIASFCGLFGIGFTVAAFKGEPVMIIAGLFFFGASWFFWRLSKMATYKQSNNTPCPINK